MRVKSWNCSGLPPKIRQRWFRQWLDDADIVNLQETFIDTAAVQFSGFAHFVRPAIPVPRGKKGRPKGGLITLVSSQLMSAYSVTRVDDLVFDGLECLCLKFDRVDASRVELPSSFLVFNFYVISQPAQFDYNSFFFALEAFCLAFDAPVVISGDFNAHLVHRGTAVPNVRDRDFREFAVRAEDGGYAFFPNGADLNTPTFLSDQGCTVIDYFFVRGVQCSRFKREDLTDKGHRALQLDLDWPPASVTELHDRSSHRRHLRETLPSTFFNSIFALQGLTDVASYVRAGLSNVFSLFVLTVGSLLTVSRGSGPSAGETWYRYLSEAELNPLLSLEREVGLMAAMVSIGPLPSAYISRARDLRRLRRTLHALATRRLYGEVRDAQGDPTHLWSMVRKFRVSQDRGALPIDTLVHHFCSVFNRTGDPIPVVFCGDGPLVDEELDRSFSFEELDLAVKNLSKGTAPGPTGVGNDVLQSLYAAPGGAEFFLHLFNACLEGAELPTVWRCTELFLLYKGKGLVTDPGSYRGIALMDSSLKLFERLLYARLAPWASARDLIPDCQFGFRSGAGTLDAVFTLLSLVWKYVTVQRSRLFVCLIDFQKAFPSVDRALLVKKLGLMGVSAKFRGCICAIFYKNTFALRAGTKVTREFPVTTGLREGSVLSPLLFSLFIADMTNDVLSPFDSFLQCDPSLNNVRIPGLLYADDLVLISLSADLLRTRLHRLADYAFRNKLTVNVSKCEVVCFGGGRVGHGSFRYNRQLIPVRTSVKYLGVWVDADRSGRSLCNSVLEKFRAGVPVFFGLCRRMRIAEIPRVYQLAQALLFSLLYGAEFVFDAEVIRRCEVAWWKGVRQFYGLPNGVSNSTLALLFPEFSLLHKVMLGKVSLMCRGLRALPTLLPEALIFDRGCLFPKHGVGFTQGLHDWGSLLGLTNAHLALDRAAFASELASLRSQAQDSHWDNFARMSSTQGFARLLGSRMAFRHVAKEAARHSRLGLRVLLLAATGSLAQSYLGVRYCSFCKVKFDFEHFVSCPALGHDLLPCLTEFVSEECWEEFVALLLSRFRTFVHLFRSGQCTIDECDLFDSIDDVGVAEDE